MKLIKFIRRVFAGIAKELGPEIVVIGEGENRRVFLVTLFYTKEITSICNGR